MAQKRRKKIAVVQCLGGCHAKASVSREERSGDCRQAMEEHPEGILECGWGCLGEGSCVSVCRPAAISINSRRVAWVDRNKCVGCGLCVRACPKNLIRLTTLESTIYPACVNRETGGQTRKACEAGCIACGICVKSCPVAAIAIQDSHAVIDESKCIACGMCAVKCPRGIIVDADGIFTAMV